MNAPAPARAAERPRRLHEGAAMTAASRPDGIATLLERLAAVEAGIRDDRHRQPAAVVEEIASLWTAGATVSGISARTGVSRELVRDRLRRAGALEYLFRNRHRHVQEVLERRGAELVAAYLAGESIVALAADAGVSSHTVREYMVAEGVTLRPTTGKAWKILHPRSAELIAAYEAGTSIRVLAARVGVNPDAMSLFLTSSGVALRHDRGWPRKRRDTGG